MSAVTEQLVEGRYACLMIEHVTELMRASATTRADGYHSSGTRPTGRSVCHGRHEATRKVTKNPADEAADRVQRVG